MSGVRVPSPPPSPRPPRRAASELTRVVERSLDQLVRSAAAGPHRIIVGFSGGPDSTALIWALRQLDDVHPVAAHLDHGLDADSWQRALAASQIARRLDLPIVLARRPVSRQQGESSFEALARTARYRFLETVRREHGADWIATAHHRDDQLETVILRTLNGTGWAGLAAIAPRQGAVIRPLLDAPRELLTTALGELELPAIEDPTNHEPICARNRLRTMLLPALRAQRPDLDRLAARIARHATSIRRRLDQRLDDLDLRAELGGASCTLATLARLDGPVRRYGLDRLHRRAGASHPPPGVAVEELGRQLAAGHAVGVDAGDGWSWSTHDDRLYLLPSAPAASLFTYTLRMPGETALPAFAATIRTRRARQDERTSADGRVAMDVRLSDSDRPIVRTRRPGDRIWPDTEAADLPLKKLMQERRYPSPLRNRLPLLCLDHRVVWAPGLAVDRRHHGEPTEQPGGSTWHLELRSPALGHEP